MHPVTWLAIVSAFAGFLLKTALGFCVCWALSKVIVSPKRRFQIWLGFLIGAAFYWLWLIQGFVPDGVFLTQFRMPVTLVPAAPVGKWQIQSSWAFALSLILRGIGALYLLVLLFLLLVRVRKHVHLRWVLRFASKAPEGIESLFRQIAESFDAGDVQLLVLSGIHSPATFGWLRPIVLLPPFCLKQDPGELGDIFRHELQHVRRRDAAFNTAAALCRALLFFHPAVWYAMRRLELESELACDMAVVSESPERRAIYAECLVRFARRNAAQDTKPWGLDFTGSSVQIKTRIHSVLAEPAGIPGWLWGVRATLGLLLAAGFLCIAPSLFISLSYEKHKTVRPEKLTLPVRSINSQAQKRDTHQERPELHPVQTSHTLLAPAWDAPSAAPVAVPVDTSAGILHKVRPTLPNGSWPTLKRRGGGPSTPTPASTIVIHISDQHSSKSVITKRRVIASAILAGASEAARIASLDHGGDGH